MSKFFRGSSGIVTFNVAHITDFGYDHTCKSYFINTIKQRYWVTDTTYLELCTLLEIVPFIVGDEVCS